jgi:outer membrane protein TolC
MRLLFKILGLLISITYLHAQQRDLNYFVNYAVVNSPLLKDYKNQAEMSRLDSMRIRAGMGMQVAAVSNNLYAPVINGWGYDEAITNGANVSALLTASKEFYGKHNRQNKYENIAIQRLSVLNSFKISEQDLKKNVSSLYITAFGSWQYYNFNVGLFELMTKEEPVLRVLAEKGSYKQTDYLSFIVTLHQQELLIENAKNQYSNNLALLNYTCGIEDTAFLRLSDPHLEEERIPDFFNTIFYKQFELDSLKLDNNNEQIDFLYKPKISMVADGGYFSSLAFQPARNFGISAGLSLNIPLYDGGQRKMQHDQIKISQLTRKNYFDFYNAQFHQQTNQLKQQLRAKQMLDEKINKQILYSQTLMDAHRKLVETGDVSITDYILSLGNYLSAKNMLIENTIEKYQIINELNYWNRTK